MLADSSFLCCTSFEPAGMICVRCRFGYASCRQRTPISSLHAINHIVLHSRTTSFDFDLVTAFAFESGKREAFGWLYLILLQYHIQQYYSYHTASTILAGSGAVHSTQCSARPHRAWDRLAAATVSAITDHRPRRGPTDATCGDHKTGSKAAVRHATRRPGLQILSHSTPSATGSQT